MYMNISKKQFHELLSQYIEEGFETTEEFEKFLQKLIRLYLKWPDSSIESLIKTTYKIQP